MQRQRVEPGRARAPMLSFSHPRILHARSRQTNAAAPGCEPRRPQGPARPKSNGPTDLQDRRPQVACERHPDTSPWCDKLARDLKPQDGLRGRSAPGMRARRPPVRSAEPADASPSGIPELGCATKNRERILRAKLLLARRPSGPSMNPSHKLPRLARNLLREGSDDWPAAKANASL